MTSGPLSVAMSLISFAPFAISLSFTHVFTNSTSCKFFLSSNLLTYETYILLCVDVVSFLPYFAKGQWSPVPVAFLFLALRTWGITKTGDSNVDGILHHFLRVSVQFRSHCLVVMGSVVMAGHPISGAQLCSYQELYIQAAHVPLEKFGCFSISDIFS